MSLRVVIHVLAAGLAVAITGLAPLPLSDAAKLYTAYGLAVSNAMVVAYLALTSTGLAKP